MSSREGRIHLTTKRHTLASCGLIPTTSFPSFPFTLFLLVVDYSRLRLLRGHSLSIPCVNQDLIKGCVGPAKGGKGKGEEVKGQGTDRSTGVGRGAWRRQHSNKVGQRCLFFLRRSPPPSLLTAGTTELCCLSFSQCTVGTRFFLLVASVRSTSRH